LKLTLGFISHLLVFFIVCDLLKGAFEHGKSFFIDLSAVL